MDDLTTIKGIGKATAKKLTAEGIATFAALAEADAKALSAKPGFGTEADIAAWIAEAEKLAPAGDTDEHAKTLLGSNLLPSEVAIAENVLVQLGDIVARAHKDSGLDLDAWNGRVRRPSGRRPAGDQYHPERRHGWQQFGCHPRRRRRG